MALGGVEDIDLGSNGDDPELADVVHFATESICESTNSIYHMKFVSLKRAKKQVVSGMKYILDIEIAETDCLKSEIDMTICKKGPTSTHERFLCHVEVWQRLWIQPTRQLLGEPNCKPL